MNTDEAVNLFLRDQFLASGDYHPETQGAPEYIKVLKADVEWECDCYSEYTRDDCLTSTALIEISNGRTMTWRYRLWPWHLSDTFEEIAKYLDLTDACQYWESE